MLEMENTKSLRERIPEFLEKIEDYDLFYEYNEEVLDIYEGNLLPYLERLMKDTLDERYFSLIKHRLLPINFIQKIVDKLAKSYGESPLRRCEDQEFIEEMEAMLDIDSKMTMAEEYSYLNKGYALKPKLTNRGQIKMDVIPFDKFMVIADDPSDKMLPTVFIEFLGKVEREKTVKDREEIIEVDCYIAYSDDEIIGFDEEGSWMPEIGESLNYRNPIGAIPFVYGNRGRSHVMPKQDTDFLRLAKVLPLMLSDINGALMFQCFTLIYGIDLEFQDAKMSPNAIWDLRSDPKSDKTPTIGTLEPTVDSEKALNWFKNILAMWLDSKGIDAGSITKLDSQEIASGLSKAMDELDTTEARKKSINYLEKEEKDLFILLAKLNNYWLTLPESRDLALRRVDVDVVKETFEAEFKEPTAKLDYTTEIKNSIDMLREGLSYREKEVRRLHPYASEEEINQIFFEFGESRYEVGAREVEEAITPQDEDPTTLLTNNKPTPPVVQEPIEDNMDGEDEE